MASETPDNDNLVKVFIWTTGRCLSNALLKCMTYVPDSVVWHEPYTQIRAFSDLIKDPKCYPIGTEKLKISGGKTELDKIEHGYDASDKDFDWLKEQLEADYPGKRVLVVKNAADDVLVPSLQVKIPQSFRHTFLIRNPRKVIPSYAKVFFKMRAKSEKSVESIDPYEHIISRFMQQNELWKHVKAEGLESHPLIIDADDLMENPKGILEAYFKELGIPFTEDMLTWPAGDDYLKNWMVPKQNLLVYKSMGFREVAEESTGFNTKPKPATSTNGHSLKDLPSDKLAKVQQLMNKVHPYYEEMYAERLLVQK